jgi:hypothetical protein
MSYSKIKLPYLSQDDLTVISNATNSYADALQVLTESENRSQQHIHLSILTEFRYEILKKLTKREPSKNNSFKMELHTAFLLYDALQHYSRQTDSSLEAAVLRRIVMELFSLLPFTQDHDQLSVMSDLNFSN